MVISEETEELCTPLLVEMRMIIVICMYCRRFLSFGPTHGGKGGVSHGLCKPLCDKAKEGGWK